MLFATTSVCSPSLSHPCGGNQSGGTGEHGQSSIRKKPTKVLSLPPPRYVGLHYAIHVVGTKVAELVNMAKAVFEKNQLKYALCHHHGMFAFAMPSTWWEPRWRNW